MSQPSATLQRAVPHHYRARALWRGCRWAVNMNPWRGRTQVGSNFAQDSRSQNLGRFSGGVPVPASAILNGGRFVSSNAGATGVQWDDNQWQAIPQLGIYEWLDTGGFSLACTMQFKTVPGDDRRILTKRFGTTSNFHCGALSFSFTAGRKFEFSYCNGGGGAGNVQSVFSTSGPTAGVTYNIVGRHWGNNALSRAEIWVNGKLEGVVAAPTTWPAYKKDPPILFFTDTGSGNPTLDGYAAMGGLWARPLTTAEIQALNVNPFVMWGPPVGPLGFPHAGLLDGCRCGGPWLHAWSGLG